MKTRSIAAWLSLPIVLLAVAAGAQTFPVEVEAGYQWTDVEGNEDLYRTQVNEQSGFVIRNLSFFTSDFDGPNSGFVDHFRIDAVDLSRGPASSLRIDAGKAHAYRLRLGYRSFDVFSALPNFANPLIGQGIVPGQHTWDRERKSFDAELELLSFGERIIPFIGYGYGTYEGPGSTTYALGGDEFRLDSDLEESEHEIRVGAGFNLGTVYGSVMQGWRSFEAEDRMTLSAGAGAGNNPNPILGRPLTAGSITRHGSSEGDTPFTNIALAAQPNARLRIAGNYSRFTADAESFEDESAAGSFLSFPLSRFFEGFEETTTSDAENRTWRGNVRGEFAVNDRIDVMAGYRRENREMRGTALADTLFLDSITFGGGDPRDFPEELHADSAIDRDFAEVEIGATLRVWRSLIFRVGASQADHEVVISPDLHEISVPGNQEGTFERSVNALEAMAAWGDSNFNLSASYRTEGADDPIFRTDFIDRDRIRLRAGFALPSEKVRFGFSVEESDQESSSALTGFDATARDYTIDAELAPWETFRIRGAYTQMKLDSEITIRRPETFALDISRHEENWDSTELGFAFTGRPVSLDASMARLENSGTLPYIAHRYRARAAYDFHKNLGVAGEWARDEYDEENEAWGRYEGNRFGIFFRYRP